MYLVFVRSIHKHESCDALRAIRCKHTNVEAADGFADEHDRSSDPTAGEEFGQLARVAACCPR